MRLGDAADRDLVLAEDLDEGAAGFVVAHHADGQGGDAEGGEVHDGVGSAAGNQGALAMLEDEHRGFAGDAGDLAGDELVGDEVGHDEHAEVGERLDDAAQLLRAGQSVMERAFFS